MKRTTRTKVLHLVLIGKWYDMIVSGERKKNTELQQNIGTKGSVVLDSPEHISVTFVNHLIATLRLMSHKRDTIPSVFIVDTQMSQCYLNYKESISEKVNPNGVLRIVMYLF